MTGVSLPEGLISAVLAEEASPVRFEQFCCDLFTEVDQRDYLPTSRSWDLARDGRSLPNADGLIGLICCGTEADFDTKVETDLVRALRFVRPAAVYFCSNRKKSEDYLEKIKANVRRLAPSVISVDAFGGYQLTALAHRHPASFITRYAAEIYHYRDMLSENTVESLQLQINGLRVALTTQFHDDAAALRQEIVHNLILTALSHGPAKTAPTIAKHVSDALHLPKVIAVEYFRDPLDSLRAARLLACDDKGCYSLEPAGQHMYARGLSRASAELARGEQVVHRVFATLLGQELDRTTFALLWRQLQDELANFFFANGLKVIGAIDSVISKDSVAKHTRPFGEMLEGIRTSITNQKLGGARTEEVAQAVVDLFDTRDSELFSWLTELAAKYVGLCSLGLEPSAQSAVLSELQRMDIILDTDVVLSYLSKGERPHEAVGTLLTRWRAVGGDLVITPPVLDEAAYHAWRSNLEFRDVQPLLSKLRPEEIPQYADTAFVRGFCVESPDNHSYSAWGKYISEFIGREPYDASKIAAILKDEGFAIIEKIEVDAILTSRARDKLYQLRKIDPRNYAVPKSVSDRVDRDARLIGYLKHVRQVADPGRTVVIVSSSPVMQRAAMSFEVELGEPAPVWPIASLAFLVSLAPGVRMTLSVLKSCLFAEGASGNFDRILKLALAVIKQSRQYTLGYSRRVTLRRELNRRIDTAARECGERNGRDLAAKIADNPGEHQRALTEIIAGAIDALEESQTQRKTNSAKKRPRKR